MAGKPARRGVLRRIRFWTAVLAAVAFGLAGAALLAPTELPGRQAVLLIRPGEGMPAVARALQAEGLVRNARAFVLLARLGGRGGVRAGEFALSSGWSAWTILQVITTTNGIRHRIAVREGLPWWKTAELFARAGLCDVASFERAMHNATLLKKYGIPGDSAEGFLFPDTYMISRTFGDGGTAIVGTMLKEFDVRAKRLWPKGRPAPQELRRIVTLASIVERETGAPAERPRIAGVFANRLGIGMPLQSDPTIIYGLGPTFDGSLTRADLTDAENPYNTYAHYGLPPGPICSPGLAALEAALHPEANDFLYFVAKGDGTHEFSRTLEEQNAAVARYQRHRSAEYRSWPAERLPAAAGAADATTAQASAAAKPAAVRPGPQAEPAPQVGKPAAGPQKTQRPLKVAAAKVGKTEKSKSRTRPAKGKRADEKHVTKKRTAEKSTLRKHAAKKRPTAAAHNKTKSRKKKSRK